MELSHKDTSDLGHIVGASAVSKMALDNVTCLKIEEICMYRYRYLGFRLLPAPECQVDWKRKEKLLELEGELEQASR